MRFTNRMVEMAGLEAVRKDVDERVLKAQSEILEGYRTYSAFLYGSRLCGYARDDSDYDVLAVLSDYPDGVRYHRPSSKGVPVAFMLVDKELFEMDVKQGSLGEFVSGRLLSPYLPLINGGYLRKCEVDLKRRVIIEELKDLVAQYGELSRGLVIGIEYVIYSRMKKRMRMYPPLRYSYLNMLHEKVRERNLALIKDGFADALKFVADEKVVKWDGARITLTDEFIDNILKRKHVEKVVNVLEFSRRALRAYLAQGRAGRVSLDILARELTAKIGREIAASSQSTRFEDPKSYLYLKTATGLVNMNEKASLADILSRYKPGVDISLKNLGGVLNEVYQASVGDESYVVKKFSDWFGFKWFSLNLVALGTRYFTVSGRERLGNEYGMGNYLAERNLPAQKVFYISVPDRVLVKEYVKGRILSDIAKDASKSGDKKSIGEVYSKTGRFFSQLHLDEVVLGDSKPENIIYSEMKEIIPLDLEQSKKGGSKPWDVAEFLYYLGHYLGVSKEVMREVTESFIAGYLQEGDPSILRKASGLNYIKVFSFWTPPQTILTISNLLKKA